MRICSMLENFIKCVLFVPPPTPIRSIPISVSTQYRVLILLNLLKPICVAYTLTVLWPPTEALLILQDSCP